MWKKYYDHSLLVLGRRRRLFSSLSPLHIKGTAQLLLPESTKSPHCLPACLGSVASPLYGNLLRLGSFLGPAGDDAAARLATLLLFQPHRYASPILTKTKSMAAAYLTPERMGAIMGISHRYTGNDQETDAGLESIGVKSNHVDGHRTGVSLQRWKDIIGLLCKPDDLSHLLWLRAFWNSCHSKRDVYIYYSALEEITGKQLIRPEYHSDSELLESWIKDTFAREELNDVRKAKNDIIHRLQDWEDSEAWDDTMLESLELVVAQLAFNRNHALKPPITPGRFGFDGGAEVPDCVEMTVREVLEFLLWNGSNFDALPCTKTHPKLLDFFTASSIDGSIGGGIGNGSDWFDMLSNLADSHYISRSPNDKPYELTPTLSNVAITIHQLLYPDDTSNRWMRLEDISNLFPNVKVETARRSFRAALSEETVHHETALLTIHNRAMEIRQDRSHAISTVTHLPRASGKNDETSRRLLETCLAKRSPPLQALGALLLSDFDAELSYEEAKEHNDDTVDQERARKLLLSLPYGPDQRLSKQRAMSPLRFACRLERTNPRLMVLSLPFGPDRRVATPVSTDLDRQHQSELFAYSSSCDVQLAALKWSRNNANLFRWLASESPDVTDQDNSNFPKLTQAFREKVELLMD